MLSHAASPAKASEVKADGKELSAPSNNYPRVTPLRKKLPVMKDSFGFVIDELAAKMSRSAAASEAVRENAIVSEVDALLERLALPGEDAIVVPPMQEDHHEGDDDSDSNNNDDSERGYEQQEDMTFQQIITADPEQIEYRSYYGDPRLKAASSSPARDLRQNTFLNDLGENEMDLDVDSMRARKNQRDALLASVDPVTARKCLMAEHFFLDHYFELLTYLHQRKLRTQDFKMKHVGLRAEEATREWKLHCQAETSYLRQRRCRTQVQHFHVLAQIGQGGYGQVFLVKKKDTGEICALKKMGKALLHKMNEVEHILTERDVLTQTKSPWLVKLLYAFQDFEHVYLAMEYVAGGDLRTMLNNFGIMQESNARFYAAEMFVAVSELHRLGYIHRDLKPENFLIDKAGHIKLTDFGLSKGHMSSGRVESLRAKLNAVRDATLTRYSTIDKRSLNRTWRQEEMNTRAYSLVGSPDYMAPEILTDANHASRTGVYAPGYDYLVDYWSLGCIVFEFLCGYAPFTAPSMEEVWVNVYHWQEVLERPKYEGADIEYNVDDVAWSFVTKLIAHRHERLSSIGAVLEHPWFLDFNRAVLENFPDTHIAPNSPELWNLVRRLPAGHPLEPPFVPELKEGAEDHSNFDDFSDASAMELYKDVYEKQDRLQNQLLAASQNGQQVKTQRQAFVGFTFRHKKALNNGPSSSTATSGNPGPALPPKPTPDMMTKIREMARMSQ